MSNGRVREVAGKALVSSAAALSLAILSGCGIGPVTVANHSAAVEGSETVSAIRIDGHVHGGAYPIQGATVVLMETQNNGTWTSSTGNYVGTAKPLYVTASDSQGSFSFPDTGWTCDAGQYVYIEVTGGHTVTSNNPNVVQLGVVGDCATDLGNKAQIDGLNVFISEPSTVAAAYALRPFLSIHSGNLTGTPSDGKVTLSNTIPLADITSQLNNNAVSATPSLNPVSTATGAVQVSLASAFNTTGIYTDGSIFSASGGADGDGNGYSSQLLGTSLTYGGVPYTFGTANQSNIIRANGGAVTLPSGSFNTLNVLAAGVNGAQASQNFVVTYTDGTTTTFTQSISDWYGTLTQGYAGESVALATAYRDMSTGAKDARQFNIYQYAFTLNRSKLVKSLTLPNNNNVVVLAVTATSNTPVCSGVRAGTALSCTAAGLAHGFQNAYNLVDQVTFTSSAFPSGISRTTLPGNTKSVAPREMLNTLGNILQECVDSTGGTVTPSYAGYTVGTTRCGDLFYYTTPPGSTTSPTNTLQAALNMASYPSNNVSQLMALKPRNVFFSPEISQISSPQNFAFTLSVFYTGTSLGDTFNTPADLALDVQDNLYVVYGSNKSTTLDELTSSGKGLFSTQLSSVTNPQVLAVDTNGFAWVTDDTANTGGVTGLYTSINATKTAAQGSAYKSITIANGSAAGLAFDASSNMFVGRDSSDANPTAIVLTAASGYGTSNSYKLAYPIQHASANALGNFYAVGTNGNNSHWLSLEYATCSTGTAPVSTTFTSANATSMAVNDNEGTTAGETAFVPAPADVRTITTNTSDCTNLSNNRPAKRETGLDTQAPSGSAMDGNLSFFWSDATTGYAYAMPNVGASTDITNATVTSFAPCYYTGSACASTSSANFQGMAIDSSGAMWFLSQGGTYGLVQTIGIAAPTWPLLASENSGVVVQ